MSGWILGSAISLCGNVLINTSANLLKYHHAVYGSKGERSKPWFAGVILFGLGNLCNFAAFAFAAQSLLAALGTVQFVSNVINAWVIFGVRPTLRSLIATVIIVGGNCLVVLYASHNTKDYTTDELYDMYFNGPFLTYIGCCVCIMLLMIALYHYLTKHDDYREKYHRVRAISFVIACAIIGTQSVSLAKSVSVVTSKVLAGDVSQLEHAFTYVILVSWTFTMIFWINRMNKALILFDGGFIIPLLQVVWTFLSILGGGFYFEEFEGFTLFQTYMFTFGVLIVLFGIFLLAPPESKQILAESYDEVIIRPTWSSSNSQNAAIKYSYGAPQAPSEEDDHDDMSERLRHSGRRNTVDASTERSLRPFEAFSSALSFPVLDYQVESPASRKIASKHPQESIALAGSNAENAEEEV